MPVLIVHRPQSKPSPSEALTVLEVATLIAMPSSTLRRSGSVPVGAQTATNSEPWARHDIGITRVAYNNALLP